MKTTEMTVVERKELMIKRMEEIAGELNLDVSPITVNSIKEAIAIGHVRVKVYGEEKTYKVDKGIVRKISNFITKIREDDRKFYEEDVILENLRVAYRKPKNISRRVRFGDTIFTDLTFGNPAEIVG